MQSLKQGIIYAAGQKDCTLLKQFKPIVRLLHSRKRLELLNTAEPPLVRSNSLEVEFLPMGNSNPVMEAIHAGNYEGLRILKGLGFKFIQPLKNRMSWKDADTETFFRQLVMHKVYTPEELKLFLMSKPMEHIANLNIQKLLKGVDVFPVSSKAAFLEDIDDIKRKMRQPLTLENEDFLDRISRQFARLPEGHKKMIEHSLLRDPFQIEINTATLSTGMTTNIPGTYRLDAYSSGAHFNRGNTEFPRIIGLVTALEQMSKNPRKIYRWFTQSHQAISSQAYPVDNFESLFPSNTPGQWNSQISRDTGRMFTHNFDNAMKVLRKNNGERLDVDVLDGADIAFTLDNNDYHDLTCRIQFKRNRNKGGLIGECTVIDSIPQEREQNIRRSQENTFRNFNHLIKAYFKHAGMPLPVMRDANLIYTNMQVNGYCTSLAVYQMLNEVGSDSSKTGAAILKKDTQGQEFYDTANYEAFIRYVKQNILKAGLFLPRMPEVSKYIKNKNAFVDELALAYRAIRMDGINVVEGNTRDHYETLPHAKTWEKCLVAAKKEYAEKPSLHTLFENENNYAEAKFNAWRLTPVNMDDEFVLLDPRELDRLRSKDAIARQMASKPMSDYMAGVGPNPVKVSPNQRAVARKIMSNYIQAKANHWNRYLSKQTPPQL